MRRFVHGAVLLLEAYVPIFVLFYVICVYA
jgi:hypothetical protein